VFGLAGLVPVLGYVMWYHATFGRWSLSGYTDRWLYARVSEFALCSDLRLPAYERALCPAHPTPTLQNYYMWSLASPQWTLVPPPGKTVTQVLHDFDVRILKHQPLDYARVVLTDFAYGFSPVRGTGPENITVWYFKFQSYYPAGTQGINHWLHRIGDAPVSVNRTLARDMHSYGKLYVPGPFLAICLLAGLAGAVGIGRSRRSPLRVTCALFSVTALAVLAVPELLSVFSWRYQLPQLGLLPAAGALGLTALIRAREQRAAAPTDAAEPAVA
jgi:hypothetical protein